MCNNRVMNRKIFDTLFAAKGIKMTEQRWVVLQAVAQSKDHPDAEQVSLRAKELDPTIGIATIYRTLSLLADLDIIQQHDFGEGRARYEVQNDHHHHLIDADTGDVIEFRDEDLEAIKHAIADRFGYDLLDHKLYLIGKKKA
jgi:Fur family ferric uptake transcriptional regulator